MDLDSAIAVDWSGSRIGGGRRTWLAEVGGDELIELRSGWNADSLLAWLTARATRDPALVLGLDFAFSFPAWFVTERCGGTAAAAAWAEAAMHGEDWLREVASPLWGRSGLGRPVLEGDRSHFRATEQPTAAIGWPKSVFQVGGAGTVGTASIRGMPLLARLRQSGFAIWPFDPPVAPLVVEIYPRALTGKVVKSDPAARRRYLESWDWPREPSLRLRVAGTEDGFDAAVSARQMFLHAGSFRDLPQPSAQERLEGRIWLPGSAAVQPVF
ncbi:MAG: hypothetical protein M3024_11345 [Candidatus Dormibacteraeota bacterium]|nr:hypothetical protein [Candidatus Dormibacteraeota bacterium]